MKKIIAITALFIAFAAPAFATDSFKIKVTDRPYTTGTFDDYTSRDVFLLSETPYLLLHIPTDANSIKWSFWKPDGGSQVLARLGPNTLTDMTLTLDWTGLKAAGQEWTVKGMYSVPGSCEDKSLRFSFAPEPLSAGLFLLGGAALVAVRKKRAAGKKLLTILFALFSLTLCAAPAFASTDSFSIYMTDAEYTGGDVSAYLSSHYRTTGVFQLSETPYLFMHVPSSVTVDNFKFAWWQPSTGSAIYSDMGYDGIHDVSATLPWGAGAVKTPGEWTVSAWYSTFDEEQPHLSTKFSFAPEPISAGLFLLGGGALAIVRKRRNA